MPLHRTDTVKITGEVIFRFSCEHQPKRPRPTTLVLSGAIQAKVTQVFDLLDRISELSTFAASRRTRVRGPQTLTRAGFHPTGPFSRRYLSRRYGFGPISLVLRLE